MNPRLGRDYLASKGINLFHVFDTRTLEDLLSPSIDEGVLNHYPSTVLIANAGAAFWHALEQFSLHGNDPVDDFSVHLAQTYSTEFLDTDFKLLYPSDLPISLRAVADRTGWSHPSPLGITIHPEFGTWYAFRAMFLVRMSLPASDSSPTESPCDSCVDKPCIPACHVDAVGKIGSFDLDTCARFRIREASPCAFSCNSRNRCPIGSEYRYVPEQMKYHYRRGRDSMARFYGAGRDQK
ncbi:MAG: hypothetical protein OXI60_01310 [Acidiferrobacterales bacterium]|nr:hypothetical protein [Acidiferrobacterales bacterium]